MDHPPISQKPARFRTQAWGFLLFAAEKAGEANPPFYLLESHPHGSTEFIRVLPLSRGLQTLAQLEKVLG